MIEPLEELILKVNTKAHWENPLNPYARAIKLWGKRINESRKIK